MKLSRLVSTVFVLITLGFASLSLTACQSTADSGSAGASGSSSGGSSGGY